MAVTPGVCPWLGRRPQCEFTITIGRHPKPCPGRPRTSLSTGGNGSYAEPWVEGGNLRMDYHETRTVAVFDALPAVAGTEWEPYVAAIVAIERSVLTFQPATGLWNASRETALYLSNRPILAG